MAKKKNNSLDYLMGIGVQSNLKGFKYLKYILDTYVPDDVTDIGVCKLYEMVATANDTTSSRVERAIRHSIQMLFTNTGIKPEVASVLFGNSMGKKDVPNNGLFISSLLYGFTCNYDNVMAAVK